MRLRTPWIFDVGAGIYDRLTDQAVWRAHCREMAARLPGGPVLDLGIGPGVSGIEMARASPGLSFIGVDLAMPMLERAKRHVAAAQVELPLVRADAARLPFDAGSFAAAVGHSFLYLVEDRTAVLRDVHRVLRPGGRIVFLEPNGATGSIARASAIGRAVVRGEVRFATSMALWNVFSRLHGRFTAETIGAQLAACGFSNPKAEPTLGGLGLIASAER